MPRSAGFAICSPQGIGEPHNAPRASQHLSYVPICTIGRGSQGRHHGALIQLKSRCEFRCDFHATPRCFRASELRHRCPEPRVIATGCRNSVPYRVAWGSGGRGFKSRRPDWVKSKPHCDFRGGAFSSTATRCAACSATCRTVSASPCVRCDQRLERLPQYPLTHRPPPHTLHLLIERRTSNGI